MAKPINRWGIPILVGCGVVGTVLWALVGFVRLRPPPSAKGTSQPKPAIVLVASEKEDQESRELTDLDPLFLPTEHNTSVLSLPAQVRREPGSMSFMFPPKLSELESKGGVAIAEPLDVPARAIDVLTLGTPQPSFNEVGRRDVEVHRLPARLAFVEVAEAKSGKVILSEEVPTTASSNSPAVDWLPIGFLVAIDSSGIVGSPVLMSASTSDEVESFFSDFLARKFNIGAKLSPGFYTVRVGP